MELHQLRYLLAVARTGNFSRAAAQCHVSQPSLSQQIQKLEAELGERLFSRLKRVAVPTAAGEALDQLFAAPRILSFEGEEAEAVRFGLMMATLATEFAAPGSAGSPVPVWLARAAVWLLAERAAREARVEGIGRARHKLFARFLVLVEAHFREHWPLSRYAEALGLTPERLNRLVRAETGRLPLDLVQERLTREACRHLTYIAAPISRLAWELGFEDPAYFCRFFKRQTGLTPRDFRRSISS